MKASYIAMRCSYCIFSIRIKSLFCQELIYELLNVIVVCLLCCFLWFVFSLVMLLLDDEFSSDETVLHYLNSEV